MISAAPRLLRAQAPQSPDAPAQQPSADNAKKDSPATPDSAAQKPTPAKPHRVFTNDDISTALSVPVPPGARRRLKQLNRCDRTCFHDVMKQALNFGYQSVHPRATRREMEDSLANYIEELRTDPKWQQLLLNMISAHINVCTTSARDAQRPENSPSHTPTREEILDEEERMKNYRPAPPGSYQDATSAAMSYRWQMRDPLKASFMVYQWMDEAHRDCSTIVPSQNSQDSSEEDP